MGCLVRVRVRVRVKRKACLLSFCLFARRKRGLYCIVWGPKKSHAKAGGHPRCPAADCQAGCRKEGHLTSLGHSW